MAVPGAVSQGDGEAGGAGARSPEPDPADQGQTQQETRSGGRLADPPGENTQTEQPQQRAAHHTEHCQGGLQWEPGKLST